MGSKNNTKLFFTCSLIEFIGRQKKRKRQDIADFLGKDSLERIYEYADVFHCEPIEKVAAEFIEESQIEDGTFDNEGECRYRVPDYWTIGEVYERLIEDCYTDEQMDTVIRLKDERRELFKDAEKLFRKDAGRKKDFCQEKKKIEVWDLTDFYM